MRSQPSSRNEAEENEAEKPLVLEVYTEIYTSLFISFNSQFLKIGRLPLGGGENHQMVSAETRRHQDPLVRASTCRRFKHKQVRERDDGKIDLKQLL